VWKYVSGRSSRPTDSQEKALEGDINDSKAKSDLILSISTSELRQVWNCETSKQLWEKLESIYQSKGLARKIHLLKPLILLKMKNGDDMHSHLQKFFDNLDKIDDPAALQYS